ncbi:MAG: hypothetical protein C4308_05455 [Chitinophagaceae bacterium]
MKPCLLIAALLISYIAFSQNDKYQQKKKQPKTYFQLPEFSPNTGYQVPKINPGVKFLKQDHMPCIIPDTDGIAPIPNAWIGGRYKNVMPNPGQYIKPIAVAMMAYKQ